MLFECVSMRHNIARIVLVCVRVTVFFFINVVKTLIEDYSLQLLLLSRIFVYEQIFLFELPI